MIVRELDAAHCRELLRRFPLFDAFAEEELTAFAGVVRPIRLAGGEHLFHQGEPAGSLYLLFHGRLRVWVQDEDEERRIVGEVNPGETIGEMAILTGEARSASAQAIRDSDLLEIPRAGFDQLVRQNSAAMLELSRLIVRRHQSNLKSRAVHPRVQTLGIFPASPEADPLEFAGALSRALASLGTVAVVQPSTLPEPDPQSLLLERIHRMESDHDFLLFPCSPQADPWTCFALAQADRILILCPVDADPSRCGERAAELSGTFARREVVVEHRSPDRPSGTSAWCRAFGTADRHHVLRGDARSLGRLARLVTGRGVGLVLGGGGARGFSHVGLLKALEVHDVPVDHVGGTSMGGILATQIASGKGADELRDWNLQMRRDGLLKNDYTLPLYSVVAGRHFASLFRGWIGDLEMEDLWLDCFCVSANLTKARQEVHRSGKIRHVCRATGALPGLLPPVHLDGDILVDGGVLNNVPIDVMSALDRGPVIASRVIQRTGAAATLGPDDLVSGRKAPVPV